jgi:sugar (pentulose or hexulose) kinase
MTAESLSLIGAGGTSIVEGPFARNRLFCEALSATTGRPVEPSDSGTGTMLGTLMTATGALPRDATKHAISPPLLHAQLAAYIETWRRQARNA